MRAEHQAVGVLVLLLEDEAEPEGLELPARALALEADALDGKALIGEAQLLAQLGAAIADAEGDVDEQHVDAEEGRHRPGAVQHEDETDGKAQARERQHEDDEAARRQAPMRLEDRVVEDGGRIGGLRLGHATYLRSSLDVGKAMRLCRCASFDKLRMRFFLSGIWQMPSSIFLIPCLSKDAPTFMQSTSTPQRFRR